MKFRVSVPATSANVGPGFDVMGIAFDIYNRFTFDTDVSGVEITGCEEAFRNPADNLVVQAANETMRRFGRLPPANLRLHIDADLPVSGGLGSSSTCIVAGIMAANEMGGFKMSQEDVLRLATAVEGHPDNVAPAILGGFVTSVVQDDLVFWHRNEISPRVEFYVMIPDHRVSTEEARAILPDSYSRRDCIYNLSRVPILVEGLKHADARLIRAGCRDRIHQEFRAKLTPDCDRMLEWIPCCGEAAAAYISGSGPTLCAIVVDDDGSFQRMAEEYTAGLKLRWTIRKVHVNLVGAQVRPLS